MTRTAGGMNLHMDNKLAEIAALWAEWKFALMEQRAASFEQTAVRARNRRAQIERRIVATPARTPLGGLIKLAIHGLNAEGAGSRSSTYGALACKVGHDPGPEARERVRHREI